MHSQERNWAAQLTPEASGRGSIGNFPTGDIHHLREQINNKYSFITVVSHSRNNCIKVCHDCSSDINGSKVSSLQR